MGLSHVEQTDSGQTCPVLAFGGSLPFPHRSLRTACVTRKSGLLPVWANKVSSACSHTHHLHIVYITLEYLGPKLNIPQS